MIIKKSKTLVFEGNRSQKKFQNILETIHEVDSKIDSSELSYNEENNNKYNVNLIWKNIKFRLR